MQICREQHQRKYAPERPPKPETGVEPPKKHSASLIRNKLSRTLLLGTEPNGWYVKAFLSHSSKDKAFVGEVAKVLGSAQVEYDEKTFEFTLNTRAIRQALVRSDLFVFFLSANSMASSFVAEEERTALELRAAGLIKKVLIFAIDGTSYRALPDWLREINVTLQLSTPAACARRIQAKLLELAAEDDREASLYLGREETEKELRRAVSVPPKGVPVALHIVGHHGIGRRTFLRNSLVKYYPKFFEVFLEITLRQFDGPEDLFRALYQLHVASSLEEAISEFEAFSKLAADEQVKRIANIISEMAEQGEFVLLIDEGVGGTYSDDGDYQQFIAGTLKHLEPHSRPVVGFIQSRMMPLPARANHPRSYHTFLRPLSDETVRELLRARPEIS